MSTSCSPICGKTHRVSASTARRRRCAPRCAAGPAPANQQPQEEVLAGPPGGEALPELGRVVHHVPLSRSLWLSSGSVERRANGVAPKPGPSGSPSALGARMSATCALAAHVRHQRVRHAPACRPLGSRPKLVSQKKIATWLSLVVVVVGVVGVFFVWLFFFKKIMLKGLTLAKNCSSIFVCKMCVSVPRPMKIVTFPRNNGDLPNWLLIFFRIETHSEQKSMEIVKDFVEKSFNDNSKPWKSSRILRVNPNFFIFSLFNRFFFFHFFAFFNFFMCLLVEILSRISSENGASTQKMCGIRPRASVTSENGTTRHNFQEKRGVFRCSSPRNVGPRSCPRAASSPTTCTDAHAYPEGRVRWLLSPHTSRQEGHPWWGCCCCGCQMLVCLCVGLLVCWCVGLLFCCFVVLLFCWCVGVLVCWCVCLFVCLLVGLVWFGWLCVVVDCCCLAVLLLLLWLLLLFWLWGGVEWSGVVVWEFAFETHKEDVQKENTLKHPPARPDRRKKKTSVKRRFDRKNV